MRFGKRGDSNWTMTKLMKIILALVVLLLLALFVPNIAYGVEDIEGYANNALGMLKFWESSGGVGCFVHDISGVIDNEKFLEDMGISKDGIKVGACEGVCNISGGGLVAHRLDGNKFERLDGSDWKKWDALFDGSVEDAKRDWEVYHGGLELLASLEHGLPYPKFLQNKPSVKFVLYGDGRGPGGDIVATWKNNEWTIVKGDNMFYAGGYVDYDRDDEKALDLFYKEVTKTANDNVYWKVLGSEEVYDRVNDKGLSLWTILKGKSSIDELYAGIVMAEHNSILGVDFLGIPKTWIRTEVKGSGSSAYGPAQLTMDLAKSYYNRSDMEWSPGEKGYLKRFIEQGCLFLLHGGGECTRDMYDAGVCSEGMIDLDQLNSSKCKAVYINLSVDKDTRYDVKYDYGGSGNLISLKDKQMYKQVVMKMINDVYVYWEYDEDKMLREWRFGRANMYPTKEVAKKKYSEYEERFYSAFVEGGNKLDSDIKKDLLKSVFKNKKAGFLEELNPSREDVEKLKGMLDGEVIKIGDESFDVSVDESVSPFVISFSFAGVGKYGMQYSSYGADKSELFFGSGGSVILEQSPFVLVEKKGSSWVEIGSEGIYKLREKEFESVWKATLIRNFLKVVCL